MLTLNKMLGKSILEDMPPESISEHVNDMHCFSYYPLSEINGSIFIKISWENKRTQKKSRKDSREHWR